MKKRRLYSEFIRGLWQENPVFRLLLGMCPTLAVTTSALNGLAMGLAASFVLICSSFIISLFRKLIPNQVRIAAFTVVIATFVTIADLFLAARFPLLSKSLGPYVPLIVVNCIILCRAEAFASKNPLGWALWDAFSMGAGFTIGLVVLGSIRELLGSGGIFNLSILGAGFRPWVVMILPAGAFITLGILIGIMNLIAKKTSKRL